MLTYLSYQYPPHSRSLALPTFNPNPHKKVAVEYGVGEAFNSQNSPYFTATNGWDVLETQIGSHAFDGELGACHGMNHGERAVNHVAGGKDARHGGHTVLIDRKQATMVGL